MVAIYSTFLQRAYDQLIHDVALQNLPVVFALDRAGLVGATARRTPAPTTSPTCAASRTWCVLAPPTRTSAGRCSTPRSARTPDGGALPARQRRRAQVQAEMTEIPFGKGEIRRQGARRGQRIAILAFGTLLRHSALAAAERIDATVVNMRFVKPLDVDLVTGSRAATMRSSRSRRACTMGGAGSAVPRPRRPPASPCRCRARLPDAFIDHARRPGSAARHVGLDAAGIEAVGALSRFAPSRDCGWRRTAVSPERAFGRPAPRPIECWHAWRPPKACGLLPSGPDESTGITLKHLHGDPRHQCGRDERHPAIDRSASAACATRCSSHGDVGAADGRDWSLASTSRCPPSARAPHVALRCWLDDAQRAAALDAASLRLTAPRRCSSAHAAEGAVEAAFPFFLRKRAPVTGVESLLDYQVWIVEAAEPSAQSTVWAGVVVPVKSLCPCSKEISTTARTTSART